MREMNQLVNLKSKVFRLLENKNKLKKSYGRKCFYDMNIVLDKTSPSKFFEHSSNRQTDIS